MRDRGRTREAGRTRDAAGTGTADRTRDPNRTREPDRPRDPDRLGQPARGPHAAHLDAAGIMAAGCLCFRARRVARAITRVYAGTLRPLGIQAPQLTLLNAIALSGEEGVPMGALAEFLELDPTTLSRNVRPLERKGLVRVTPSPEDARTRILTLTAAGRRTVAEALPLWREAHESLVSALGAKEAAALGRELDDVVRKIGTSRPDRT